MKKPEKSRKKRIARAKKAIKRVKRLKETQALKFKRREQYEKTIILWKHRQNVALEKLMGSKKSHE